MARSISASGSSKSWCMAMNPKKFSFAATSRAMKSLMDSTVWGFTATECTMQWVMGVGARES